MRPTLLDDLTQLCQQAGAAADQLCSQEAHDDPLTAVLRQSIALRDQGFDALSLQLLDQAQSAGISSGWMNDNRARALIRLGRIEPALELWSALLTDGADAALQACAQQALARFQWPQDLVGALEEGNLQEARHALDRWFDGLEEATLGTRELLQVVDQGTSTLLRLIPLLKQRLERESFGDGQVLLHGLQQRTSPAVVEQLLRIGPNTLLVMGCLSAAGPAEAVVGTVNGLWCLSGGEALSLQRQGAGADESFALLVRLPLGESLDQLWINGFPVSWTLRDLRGRSYLDNVELLLSLCRLAQIPLRSLPQVMDSVLGEALLELSQPLRDQAVWSSFIQQAQRFGRPAPEAEITVVIPLYGRWEFLRGHVAGFAMDPWFQQGRVRLLYVCDDPRLHLLQRWCAMHLAHEALDISVISLRRNMGFGMACNIGVQAAETPLVCLMNSDVMPSAPGWLAPLHQRIRERPEQLLAPLLLYDTGLIQHAGMTTEVQDNGCRGFPANIHPLKGLSVPELQQRHPQLDPYPVDSLSAAMLLFERNRFLAVGGFHPAFGRGDFEDLELSQRWKQEQGELWMVPTAQLMHLERQSMASGADESAAWALQANAWLAMALCPNLGR